MQRLALLLYMSRVVTTDKAALQTRLTRSRTLARRRFQIGEHALPLGMAAMGAWLVSVLFARLASGLFEARWSVLLVCAATLLVTELLVRIAGTVLGIEESKRVAPAAWFAAILAICNALTLILWPSLYASNEVVVRHVSAWMTFAAISPILNAWFWAERT
jgi:hypothetical protein